MTLMSRSILLACPKHSTSVPSSEEVAVPLSVDVKEGPLVPNPVPGLAVRELFGPQGEEEDVDVCAKVHSLVPNPTLQMVLPLISPVTVHLKVKVSPGQVGGATVNCPATSGKINTTLTSITLSQEHIRKKEGGRPCYFY